MCPFSVSNVFSVASIILWMALLSDQLADAQTHCPVIVRRSEWNARAGRSTLKTKFNAVPFVVVHHTAGNACSDQASCAKETRQIQKLHIVTNGWANIGYNFLVGGDGQVYEGRGWGRRGSHAPGYNSQSVGIAMIGTFTDDLPTASARSAVQQLIACGVQLGHIRREYSLVGHRQTKKTECPGIKLFNEIRNWSRFDEHPSPL